MRPLSPVWKRIARGFGANVYGVVVVVIIQLAGVPILLHFWGVQLYGEWLILFAIPAYLSMTDLGFSQSAGNDMTARVARGDNDGALVVFQSLCALILVIALLSFILITALVFLLPLGKWIQFSVLNITDIRWILWLLATSTLVKLFDGVNHAGFRTCGDYPLHRGIHLTGLLIQNIGIWLAAFSGGGPRVAALAFLIVPMIQVPLTALLLTKRHSWMRIGLGHMGIHQLRVLVRPALANLSMPLASALNVQGMVLVVGAILGPLAVVVFSSLRTLTRLVVRIVISVSDATEPELASAWGSSDHLLLRRLYVYSLQFTIWIIAIAALLLVLLGKWLLLLWTHGKVKMDTALFHWLLASAVASVAWYGGITLLKAANRHLRATLWYVSASLITILLAAVLLHFTGSLANAGLALLAMDSIMASYVLVVASKMADISLASIFYGVFDPRPMLMFLWNKARTR